MKKTYIAILTAAAGLCSCIEMMDSASQADVVNPLNVSFKVKAVTGFVDADGNGTINTDFPVDGLTVRFTNFEEDAVIETLTDENGIAQTEVAPGNYTISVFGESESEGNTYYLNGSVQNKAITKDITPEQALNHPTWNMGPVVTINSSTLMNKGLEVIEASRLFDVPPSRIDVTVHPQSIVHSMVEFRDGATIAQASPPDMRLPIALGLSAPERLGNVAAACDWTKAATWTFEPLDNEAFPAVNLARHCLESSEKHTAVLNAANEQAVHAFLEHRLPYLGIVDTVREVLDEMDAELRGNPLFASVEEMSRLEQEARARADKLINK